MLKCVLNVTDHEYDKILQMNHDAIVWNNSDHELFHGLKELLGKETADQLYRFEECRMEKHNNLNGFPRVQSL